MKIAPDNLRELMSFARLTIRAKTFGECLYNSCFCVWLGHKSYKNFDISSTVLFAISHVRSTLKISPNSGADVFITFLSS